MASPSSVSKRTAPQLAVLTNQLHFAPPTDWSALTERYRIWRYRLSESQNRHRKFADKNFYARFTNDYKNKFEQPFYFFTFDEPRAALYALLPVNELPRPWHYAFGKDAEPEAIEVEPIEPDELRPQTLLKLLLALCFYENGPQERERRVCQSHFYLRVKGAKSGKTLTAIEVKPRVDEYGNSGTVTLTVEANTFERIEPATASHYTHLGAFYELFDSQGNTYLRQLRPNQVAGFQQPLYQRRTFDNQRTTADWYHNGSKKYPEQYKQTRSYLVRQVQERLLAFLHRYGFAATLGEEPMQRLKAADTPLPLQRLPTIQVLDNRLNKATVSAAEYMTWLTTHPFKQGKQSRPAFHLPFELVTAEAVAADRPLLVLIDADRPAFQHNDGLGLLALAGHEDPYQQLYQSLYQKLPSMVKQSLNVNPNDLNTYAVASSYLTYTLPEAVPRPTPAPTVSEGEETSAEAAPTESDDERRARQKATQQRGTLNVKLEVCLSELWLKWVLAGLASCPPATDCLPHLTDIADWGFLTGNSLLYLEQGTFCFADVTTPEGKRELKERFVGLRELKQQFMARQPKFATLTPAEEWKADEDWRKAHFVLIGRTAIELERTDIIALPNWPVIEAIKLTDPTNSAKKITALSVYAGGVWHSLSGQYYVVSGYISSQLAEPRGHHFYRLHHTSTPLAPYQLATLLNLLNVTFVRRNQLTVWPYPFDLLRLRQEANQGA